MAEAVKQRERFEGSVLEFDLGEAGRFKVDIVDPPIGPPVIWFAWHRRDRAPLGEDPDGAYFVAELKMRPER